VVAMTTTAGNTHRLGYPSREPAEVVALLVDDGSAASVAAVAVQEAVERQAPVRFLQVVPAHLGDEARSLVEERMFRAGLHALRGHPRTASVFQVVACRPSAVLRRRSQDAALVVVGVSNEQAPARPSLGSRCARVAGCPVRTVPFLG
jgi:hypothetical protein